MMQQNRTLPRGPKKPSLCYRGSILFDYLNREHKPLMLGYIYLLSPSYTFCFMELAMKFGNFNETSIEHQRKVLNQSKRRRGELHAKSGFKSLVTRSIFLMAVKKPGMVDILELAIDELLATTKVNLKHIKILVLTAKSPTAMVINHYKLRHRNNLVFSLF